MDAQRSRTPLVLGIVGCTACLVIVVVLVVALVGLGIFRSTGTGSAGDGDPASSSDSRALPPGVAEDQPYLELSTSDDGPVLDVYLDFLCPHCKTFHDVQGEDIAQLAEDGEITLRVHPRPMLDASSTPAGYSGRAANAAVCASAEDPAMWFSAESALFENQPGADGLSDDELVSVIDEATGADIADCQANASYLSWIEDVVEPEAVSATQGTPAVLIDGETFTGDLTQEGAVKDAVEAA